MQANQLKTAELSPQASIEQLLAEAKGGERRATDRHSFFRPVMVATGDGSGQTFSAFSRDISDSGIGLLHNMPLEIAEVSLTINGESDSPVRLRAKIEWCESCGEGWYISGGRFLA